MKQGQRKVIEYYMKMQTLYQELDLSSEEEWECSNDSTRYRKKVEFEWVFEFLAGLNLELDDVRGRILDWRPFLFVTKVLIDVRLEESRQRVDGALCNADGAPLSLAMPSLATLEWFISDWVALKVENRGKNIWA